MSNPTAEIIPSAEAAVGFSDPSADAERFVSENIHAVYRLAYRLTGNPHEAEDLTQDVFVRAFRALPTFTPGNVGGWLHRITTNLFLDSMRRRKRIRFDAFPEGFAELVRATGPEPEEAFDMNTLDYDIRAALLRLSPQLRAAVVLSDLEGYSYDQVAEALDIRPGTVRSRIHRGRSQLRKDLAARAPRSNNITGGIPLRSQG